jgi:8-oxo-dGTP pyrophosphatase MutT (NUDIX family)
VYGLPVQYAAGGAVTPDLATLDGPQKSDPGYLYHATNHERASDIASNGLKTHRPSQFTDQSTWPDGSKEKRNYFARAENAWQFAPEEGKPALLRVPMAAHPFKRESTGDFYSTVPVPPSKIDYLAADKSWNPLHRLRGARASGGRTRAAGILFLSPEKEVLLMRRTENDGDQGKWAFPAGGIKKDETPEEAARRETREESGYEHEGGLSPFMHSDAQNVDFTTYLAHSQKFDPKLNHEHDGAKWVTLDEAAKLPLHPGVKAALEKLATRAGKAHGGESSGVPIVAAGGEWVISPSHVRQVGGGDIDLGHRVLDSFVHRVRKELIGTLAKLPGPRRD